MTPWQPQAAREKCVFTDWLVKTSMIALVTSRLLHSLKRTYQFVCKFLLLVKLKSRKQKWTQRPVAFKVKVALKNMLVAMLWHIFDFNFEISRHLPFKLQTTAPICYSNQNKEEGRFWSSILSATKFRNLQETFLNYSGNTCFSLTISGCITSNIVENTRDFLCA